MRMITNYQKWRQWEDRFIAQSPSDIHTHLALMDMMFELAGRFQTPLPFSLQELEHKILLAKRLHVPTNS